LQSYPCTLLIGRQDAPENVSLSISVPADLRVKMIQLGISPTRVARRAFAQEVKPKEDEQRLAHLRKKDPRLTLGDLKKRTVRIRRLLEDW